MDLELGAEDVAWRDEVRAFLAEHFTSDLREELRGKRPAGIGPHEERFWSEVSNRGWYAMTWPKEYGGAAASPLHRLIMTDEFLYAGAPILDMTITSLAPVIMEYGTPGNRDDWLPGIARGEVSFALGYSEPGAGTDLASLRTTAVLEGDEWVINGQKTWNTGAHRQTHEWLAVRTGDQPGHRGISVIIVPIDAPGVNVRPIWTWGDHRTNDVYFDDVRVPRRNLIGEVNRGWSYIVAALDNERGSLGATGALRRVMDEVVAALPHTLVDGRPMSADPVVREQVARLYADLEVAEWLTYAVATRLVEGRFETVSATVSKVMTTELRSRIASVTMSIFGPAGLLTAEDPQAPVGGLLEETYRLAPMERFGGGTNEVMRDVIAQRGAGLPRASRR